MCVCSKLRCKAEEMVSGQHHGRSLTYLQADTMATHLHHAAEFDSALVLLFDDPPVPRLCVHGRDGRVVADLYGGNKGLIESSRQSGRRRRGGGGRRCREVPGGGRGESR